MKTEAINLALAQATSKIQRQKVSDLHDWQIGAYKHAFANCCKQICPEFEFDNKPLLNKLMVWALGLDGELDPTKGLWLRGNVGSGKSTLLYALRKFDCQIKGYERGFPLGGFRIENAAQASAMFAKSGIDALEGYMCRETYAFDEVGREPVEAKHFGTPLNVMQHILQMRYNNGALTHITTNMITGDEVIEKYGDHIYDRCIEMFNIIDVATPTSRRK